MAFAPRLSNSLVHQCSSRQVSCRHFYAFSKPLKLSLADLLKNSSSRRTLFGKSVKPTVPGFSFGKIIVAGGILGATLSYAKHRYEEEKYKNYRIQALGRDLSAKQYEVEEEIPEFKAARSVRNPNDNTKIKFTLYQYQTCPFCCKARAFLDYFGLSYDVIEVNSVTRKQVNTFLLHKFISNPLECIYAY